MNQETCKNCAHYPGCLTHSAVMFFYFIMTGRDRELPENRADFNARGFCGPLYEQKSTTDNQH